MVKLDVCNPPGHRACITATSRKTKIQCLGISCMHVQGVKEWSAVEASSTMYACIHKACKLMQGCVPSPAMSGTHRWVPLAEGLGALHISQHKRHLVSSIAQQLLDPRELADAWVVVLGPYKADGHNGDHGQKHWQHNLVPSSHTREYWDDMWSAPGVAATDRLAFRAQHHQQQCFGLLTAVVVTSSMVSQVVA